MKLHFLQAFRALAAWLVVTDHAIVDAVGHDPQNPVVLVAWMLGSAGVCVFFAISGFIMVHISWEQFGRNGAAGRFLWRRIRRIVPLYWLATVAALAFHRVSAPHGADAGWSQLLQSLLFVPYRDDGEHWQPVLSQGWTLSYEMMFYAVFAAILLARRAIALPAAAVALCALVLAGPLLPSAALAHLASPIVLWFVVGMALGAVWRWGGLREPPWLARRLRVLEPFGDASYSIYLVHGFALTILLRVWTAAFAAPSAWFVPVGLAVATMAGWAVHMLVEKPLLRRVGERYGRIGAGAGPAGIRRGAAK